MLKKALSDSHYYMIANIGSKALGFLVIPILAKTISIEEFATYDLFLVIAAFLQILVTLGIDSGIAILMAEAQDDNDKLAFYYVSTLLISVAFTLLLTLLLNSYFLFFDELFLLSQTYWLMIGAYVLFSVVSYHTFNFLRWRAEAKKAALINLFSYIIGISCGLALLYFEQSVLSYLYGLLIGGFFGSIMALFMSKDLIKRFKPRSDSKVLLQELFHLSLPFIPNYLGNSLMQIVDRTVILILFGKQELGLFAVIMRLAQIPQFLSSTITGGFLPVMYNNYKTERGKKLIKDFFHAYILIIPISFLLVYLLSDWLIEIFAGHNYMTIAYLLPIAVASTLYLNATQATGFGFSIARKTRYIMYFTFASVIVNFFLSLTFGFFAGLMGIVAGTLGAGIFRIYFLIKYSEKLYPFDYNMRYFWLIAILTIILSLISSIGVF